MSSEEKAKLNDEIKRLADLKSKIELDKVNIEQKESEFNVKTKMLNATISDLNMKIDSLMKEKNAVITELNKKNDELLRENNRLTNIINKLAVARVPAGDGNGRFIVLDKVVYDSKTKMMWLKDANYTLSGKIFADAEKYVTTLSVDGYSDWQLPSKTEWVSLIGAVGNGIEKAFPEGSPFENFYYQGKYWVSGPTGPMGGISLGSGSITSLNKNNPGFIWPVRYPSDEEINKIMQQK
ncbi:MAG: DUF1566 domain-containing protein [Desulfuromonadaceae bacterium]